MTRARFALAQIVAATLHVLCPKCGEPQPSPDNGADTWLIDQVFVEASAGTEKVCVSCDAKFRMTFEAKVQVLR